MGYVNATYFRIFSILLIVGKFTVTNSFRGFTYFMKGNDCNIGIRASAPNGDIFEEREVSISKAIAVLKSYDTEYLFRHEIGRKNKDTWSTTEFTWLQSLGKEKGNQLWVDIRNATILLTNSTSSIVLGIKARTSEEGITTLRTWTSHLNLPRRIMRAYNEAGSEISPESLSSDKVYIKYNSSNAGDAYMKTFAGESVGVIFQFNLNGEFYQFGDLPLFLFA